MSQWSTQKSPTWYIVPKEPYIVPKEPYIVPKEPYMIPKEPYIVPKEPYMIPKEPYISQYDLKYDLTDLGQYDLRYVESLWLYLRNATYATMTLRTDSTHAAAYVASLWLYYIRMTYWLYRRSYVESVRPQVCRGIVTLHTQLRV